MPSKRLGKYNAPSNVIQRSCVSDSFEDNKKGGLMLFLLFSAFPKEAQKRTRSKAYAYQMVTSTRQTSPPLDCHYSAV